MGKKRNRKEAIFIKSLILGSLFMGLLSCILLKKEEIYTYMYEGSFIKRDIRGKNYSGKWTAIFESKKLKKCYIYTDFGFPIAVVEVSDEGELMLNGAPIKTKDDETLMKAIINLKDMLDSDVGTEITTGKITIKKISEREILVEHPKEGVLSITIEKTKRL